MNLSDFDYFLPPEQIAQQPVEPRDHSRMMVINRKTRSVEHRFFYDISDYLLPSDLVVVNNTRVIPARLQGKRENGGKTEVFLLRKIKDAAEPVWNVLVKPGRTVKVGTKLYFEPGGWSQIAHVSAIGIGDKSQNPTLEGICVEHHSDGSRDFRFSSAQILFSVGEVPLPPYIREKLQNPERYQTVYSKIEGAVASPTAGLHFTPSLIDQLKAQGTEFCEVTLHVGLATFRPLEEETIEEHVMHREWFSITPETVRRIEKAKTEKRRIVAVGTTSVRVLESIPFFEKQPDGGYEGETRLFIYPPFSFSFTDVMITNFHLPRSSLLLLVTSFAEELHFRAEELHFPLSDTLAKCTEFVLSAYQEAIENGYRFFSFGDACLIL